MLRFAPMQKRSSKKLLAPDVYSFTSFGEFLSSLRARQSELTLGDLAGRLGYRSQRSIGMLLSGKRKPSRQFIEKLSTFLGMDEREHRYLEKLAMGCNEKELSKLKPVSTSAKTLIPAEEVAHLAHWYHFAIRQLIQTEDFVPQPEWIAKRLGNRVTVEQVALSLRVMEQKGLIRRCQLKGYAISKPSVTTFHDLPSQAVRMHHLEQLQNAAFALKSKPVPEREFLSLCMSFDADKMNEAKKFLRRMKEEFDEKFSTTNGTEIFQFNIQFFSHSERGKS